MANKKVNAEVDVNALYEAQIALLEEKVQHLSDTNRELNSTVKEKTRESGLLRILSNEIANTPITSRFSPHKDVVKKKGMIEESAVLLLSDLHGDQEIIPHRVGGLEDYNFNAFCKRMERLVDVTIDHLINNMNNYSFKTLYIFSMGDNVSGEIHDAKAHTHWKNSIKNAVGVGEVIGMAIYDLSKYFDKIVVCGVSGNHGRRSIKKDYRSPHDNWDYMVLSQAYSKNSELVKAGKVEFVVPESYSMMINVEGHIFHISHGDDIKSFSGIPFYGLERKTRRLMAIGAVTGETPRYFAVGHFHTNSSMQTTNGEIFMNGSFPACDEFSLEALGAYSEPYQLLFGVHPKYGVTWRMPIHVRNHDWKVDEKKESRYKVKLLS